ELIREVACECPERGLMLLRLRDELRLTIEAYQTLYHNSISYGRQKAVQAEAGVGEFEGEIVRLKAEREQLVSKKRELAHKLMDEERIATKLPGRFNKMSSAMTQTSNAVNNIPAKTLNDLFTTMEKTKVTRMELQKYFKITGSSGGRYTFFKKFEVFWNTKCSVAA
ncbi:hypothetical protein BBJ29_010144, partial [Phytophthora kernoviae]